MNMSETTETVLNGMEIICRIDEYLTYALIHNGDSIVREISLKNNYEENLENVVLKVESNNSLIKTFERTIQSIGAGDKISLNDININVNVDGLVGLTERMVCSLNIKVCKDGQELAVDTKEVIILPFDQWPGMQYTPELLISYVLPNHPIAAAVLQKAVIYLKEWTGDPSMAGYQYGDHNRVKYMAAAVYAAIQEQNITYVEPPASFETYGQRVRLSDMIMEQHMGTCLDLTLLYAACLEAIGLNPFLIMMKGHIFAGFWLIEQSFSDMIMDDPSQLEKRMSKGIHEVIVVECTAMCAGKNFSFDEAIHLGQSQIARYEEFEFVIDIRRARSLGIRPLPVRVKQDTGFVVVHEERKKEEVTDAPEAVGEIFDLSQINKKETITKQMQWERKLLDLNMRNLLINFRINQSVLPLLASDVSLLEDALADGEEFRVLPRPEDIKIDTDNKVLIEKLCRLDDVKEFIDLESKQKKIHSIYTARELEKRLTKLYRSAKASMEENGASTLYLALGLLRWYENKQNSYPRYAPLIMIPVDIKRKSASKGYAMYMRDEEVQVNVTLLEFLKQNYGIQIYGLNPLPMDEHGVDLPKIFSIIHDAIMDFPKWNVLEVAVIGNFTFSQFVMWNDICGKSDFLENNKIVRSLMNGVIDWECTIPEEVDTEDAYLPVTVDSSQLRAIKMAAEGVSFVLHGPPGTGKSQTITAMIANALAKGKKVLFVAEKMAALEVVQKRLKLLGIQDFCLELHSNKSTKKAVLDQLKHSLELVVGEKKPSYDQKLDEIRKIKAELDGYAQALHIERRFGKSLRELLDIYEGIPERETEVDFDPEFVSNLTEKDLNERLYCLQQLVAAGKAVGHPYEHPLAAVHLDEYIQRLKYDLENIMSDYKDSIQKLQIDTETFIQLLGIKAPVTELEWNVIYKSAVSILSAEEIPEFLCKADSIDEEFYVPYQYLEKKVAFEARQSQILKYWNESFLKMDMESYRNRYDKALSKLFGKNKALAGLLSEFQGYASFQTEIIKIPFYINDIATYQQEAKEFEETTEKLPFAWKEILRQYPTKADLTGYQTKLKAQIDAISQFRTQISILESQGKLKNCTSMANLIIQDFNNLAEKEKQVCELLRLEFPKSEENWMQAKIALCDSIMQNAFSIREWITYRQSEKACIEKGLLPVCKVYESGVPHDHIIDIYLKSIYKTMIISIIDREPVLNNFTGIVFDEKINRFKRMDQEFKELTKDEIFYELASHLPQGFESTQISRELNILRRAISSNGRGISIRILFEQIPIILSRLCPCMLMSPISVAQYLEAKNDLFDIVIFDEASQLPTCKAVGALARGKDAVIVGDPNQMPPTAFFAGNKLDEDNIDIEDLASILDDCLALGMPQSHLHWHYRSRHESLIDFSNNEFYENSMFTFPSVNDGEQKVSLVKVDGFFERGKDRVNRGEAHEIVKEIKRRYKHPVLAQQSIGVVTFNINQQNLIEDILQGEYQNDLQFDKWANEREETLFVKNLENVQGDERDVIFFSIAFGPDSEGKLSLNFGPLNKENGWKRLNVAVTRARLEMMVFTTLTADQINLRRTKARGVEALRNFLDFAEKGKSHRDSVRGRGQKEQGIMEQIGHYLSEHGYEYHRAVGNSKFKIDIAVINPFNKMEYLLGIMLDDKSYQQSSNTHDREIGQISVLKGLGWKLHRIWAIDWWENKEKELSRLGEILDGLQEEAEEYAKAHHNHYVTEECEIEIKTEIVQAVEEKKEIQEPVIEEKGSEPVIFQYSEQKIASIAGTRSVMEERKREKLDYAFVDYDMAQIELTRMSTADFIQKESIPLIAEKMQQIIDVEAPIQYDNLIRKTLRAFEIGRSSSYTLEAADKAFKKVAAKQYKQSKVRFVWRIDQIPEKYFVFRKDLEQMNKRTPDEICVQEFKNAVCITLREKGMMDKESLIKETIYMIGFARSGKALKEAVDKGIKYGLKTGEIVQNEELELELAEE